MSKSDWPEVHTAHRCQGLSPALAPPKLPGQAGLQSPSPCMCRHPGAGSRGWLGGAQQSPQRRRQSQRPGGGVRSGGRTHQVRWRDPGWEEHTQIQQGRPAAVPGRLPHLLGHSSTHTPGLLQKLPPKDPSPAPSGTPLSFQASSQT